jgi:hypothetical protein
MIKKKIDSRIRTLIENGIQTKHRSFFVIVGDRGKDQVRAFFSTGKFALLQQFSVFFLSLQSHPNYSVTQMPALGIGNSRVLRSSLMPFFAKIFSVRS